MIHINIENKVFFKIGIKNSQYETLLSGSDDMIIWIYNRKVYGVLVVNPQYKYISIRNKRELKT